ncbi:hypothetical protein Tco_0808488 [Tanacetum coccineum]
MKAATYGGTSVRYVTVGLYLKHLGVARLDFLFKSPTSSTPGVGKFSAGGVYLEVFAVTDRGITWNESMLGLPTSIVVGCDMTG